MTIVTKKFDAIVIGAGGSGMTAAMHLAQSGFNTALISKVFPTRSHTVSAQGGITCALGNAEEDDWRWHMYDTVKGSDFLGDQDSIEYMCRTGPEVVYELEHMGLPFSRMEDGRIYQRPFGGQSKNYGGEQARRTCAAADRTGHALLHTLYQQNLKAKTNVYSEWYAIDLVKAANGQISGVVALSIATGEVVFFQARVTVLATGGAGCIYESTTNAMINTGDGMGLVLRAGLPLQDMEMWQFHPTGVAGAGCLISEGVRGEGGYLINADGERFMEEYAPSVKDLASRDVVSRAIAQEIRRGKGFNPSGAHGMPDHVKLKLDHLGADLIKKRLPGIRELSIAFAGVDPINAPIPVVPTCHYVMGGIPANKYGQVLTQDSRGHDAVVAGLYAVGECACVSVHGANRLGGNSLLDLVVFGRSAGLHVQDVLRQGIDFQTVSHDDVDMALQRLHRWDNTQSGESVFEIRSEMKTTMQQDFGVFRCEASMQVGLEKLDELSTRLAQAACSDTSRAFNTCRIECLELDNLMAVAQATANSALARRESRGAHTREDYPQRNDNDWLKHTLYYSDATLSYRAVNFSPELVEAFEPVERVY
jgi:succinate dehydrogenase flavoprotein subunit